MSQITIGGFTVGTVDGVSSVVAAQNAYDKDKTELNRAALNAAYANAYAAATSIIPSLPGSPGPAAYFAGVAIAADLNLMRLTRQANAPLTQPQVLALAGNIITFLGQGIQVLSLDAAPISPALGAAGYTIGELFDVVGGLITAIGAVVDRDDIENWVTQLVGSLGLTPNASGQYASIGSSNGAFVFNPITGDSAYIASQGLGPFMGSFAVNENGGIDVSASNVTVTASPYNSQPIVVNGPNTINEGYVAVPDKSGINPDGSLNVEISGVGNSDVDVSNAIVTLANGAQTSAAGTGNVFNIGSGASVVFTANSQAIVNGVNDAITVDANASVEFSSQSINDIVTMVTNSTVVIDNGAQCTVANASSISMDNNGNVMMGDSAAIGNTAATITASIDGVPVLSLPSDTSVTVDNGVVSASQKTGDLNENITLGSGNLAVLWSDATDGFSVQYGTDMTSADTSIEWTQNGMTFTGGDLGAFITNVDTQVMLSVFNAAALNGSIEVAAAMAITADGISAALDNAASDFYVAARLSLGAISDKYAPIALSGEIANGMVLSANQVGVLQQNLLTRIAQVVWQEASIFTVRVLGFGNDPAEGGNPSSGDESASISEDHFPLVLDLSGKGINLVAPWQSNANFDLNADGQREASGWVGADNGILVLDKNGNGTIDGASEWFGESFSADGTTPPAGQGGFAALATLTTSGAATFSRDTARIDAATGMNYFDEVQIWVDANQDGITDKGELHTLAELGIASIDLQSTPDGRQVGGGEIAATAGFTKTDGTRGDVADVGLAAQGQTPAGTWIPSTAALVFADYVSKGYAAMAKGQAQGVLNALPGGNVDISGYVAGMQSLMVDRLLTWEGFPQGLTHVPNATLITTYFGDNFSGTGMQQSTAAVDTVALLQAGVAFEATASNTATAVVAGADAIVTAQTAAEVANATGTAAARTQADSTAANAATAWGNAIASYLNANATSAQLDARMETLRQELNALVPVNDSYTQTLPGGYSYFSPGDARLAAASFTGYSGALQLFNNTKIALDSILAALAQSAGYTQAYAGQANTTVTVDNTFNLILAGAGAETFVLGSNVDHIALSSATGSVTLQGFQTGTSGDQLQFLGIGDSVKVENIAGGIQLLSGDGQHYVNLLGANADNFNLYANLTGVSSISFADFTQAGTRSIEGQRLYDGEVHITQITASNFGDTLIGDSEATILIGGSGNDTFIIEGLGYHIDGGFGNDRVSYAKLDGGVTVDLSAGTDSLGSTIFNVEQITGSAYRDYLSGDTKDNVFDGGAGNDTLTGGGGNDTYLFGRGDGADTVVNGIAANGGASSVLRLKPGIGADDLWLSRQGNDLVIQILGTFDRVTVSNWFANDYSKLGAIELDSGLALDVAAVNNLVGILAAYQQANSAFDPELVSAMPAGVSLAPSFSDHVQVPLVGQATNVALNVQHDYQDGHVAAGAAAANAVASQAAADVAAISNANAVARAWRGVATPINVPAGDRIYSYQDGLHFMPDGTPQNGIWVTNLNFDSNNIFTGKPSLVTSYRLLPNGLEADRLYFTVGVTTSSTDAIGSTFTAGSTVEGSPGHMDIILANVDAVTADLSVLAPAALAVGSAASARQQALGAAMQENAAPTASAQALARSTASNFEQQFNAAIAQFQGAVGHMQSAANEINVSGANLSALIPVTVTTVQQVWVAEWRSFSTVIPAHWNTVTTTTAYNFFSTTDSAKYSTLQSAVGAAQVAYNDAAAEMSLLLNTFAGMGDWATVQFAGAGATATADAGGDLLIAANGGNHTLLGGGGRDTFAFINANTAALETVNNFETGANGDQLLLIPAGARTAYFSENAAGAVTISYTLSNGTQTTIQVTGVNYKQLSLYDNLQGVDTADFSTMAHGAVVALNSITPRDFDGYTHVSNLVGSAFADTLSGDGQDNIITGGKGNDTLIGGAGNDTYVWRKGDGNDVILDQNQGVTADSQDVLSLADVTAQDVKFTHSGGDLLVTVLSTNETITIQNQYSNPDDRVEQIRFADGSQRALPAVDALPVGTVDLSLGGSLVTASTAPIEGQTLTVANNLSDLDGLGAISYQWYANGVLIAGATANAFTLSAAQIGKAITVTAGYTDGYGTAELVTSVATGIVVPANFAPAGSVTIAGTAVQGQTLIAANTLSDADGLGSITYQWYADNVAIAGATSDSLVLMQAQVGKAITVAASYTDGRGTAESVGSTATDAVIHSDKPLTGDVTMLLDGSAVTAASALKQGDMLTAANTLADADGLGAITYQWFADGVAITGATADSLTLAQEQVGKNISLQASYVDGFGTPESAASIATAAVANVNDTPVGSIDITGTVAQGQTLTAVNSFVDPDGIGAVTYQWYEDGVAISGATAGSLTLAQDQVGKSISVTAAYTDNFGSAESVASTATVAVENTNDAPTGAVTISGISTQEQTLTVSNTLADADGMGVVTYQWYANGVAIDGATGDSFTLTLAEVGKTVSVLAGYTDGFGTAESVASAATAAIAHVNVAPVGTVTITGIAEQGQVLTAANSLTDADGLGPISYQWYADDVAIVGANADSFTLTQAEVGKAVTVKAGYSDGYGTAESVASAATSMVANINDAPAGSLFITGTVVQGQTLVATNNLSDPDGMGVLTYQWYADGVAIDGATAGSFTLAQEQVGKAISVTAGYTDGFGTAESVAAAATVAVVNSNDAPVGAVTITGTATQGETLTAANSLNDADGMGLVTYQWYADGIAISGATADSFTLAQEQVGKSISVKAGYTDGFGTLESVGSISTAAVANVNDAPSGAVTITGMVAQGQILTAKNTLADPDGMGTVVYQWYADGVLIAGASTANLTLSSENVGQVISVMASYTDGFGASESLTSAPTDAVAAIPVIVGTANADIITGSAGADYMEGLAGDDTYYVNDAGDVVVEAVNGGTDTVYTSIDYVLPANVETVHVTATGITVTGNSLANGFIMAVTGGEILDGVGLSGNSVSYFLVNAPVVATMAPLGGTVAASAGGDALYNFTTLIGGKYDDILTGNNLPNTISGGLGNDTIQGGRGNDTLSGGPGNDTYIFARGDGVDTIGDLDTTVGNHDIISFEPGITFDQLWFQQVGANLVVSTIGTSDKITITGFYSTGGMIEEFRTSDGRVLRGGDVQNLVVAMSHLPMPPIGQLSLPANSASQLAPVYAANWHINGIPQGFVGIFSDATGPASPGQTLAVFSDLTDSDGMGVMSYQWYINDIVIPGQNTDSLLLTQDMIGKNITASVNYLDGYGTAESVSSTNSIEIPVPVFGTSGADLMTGTSGADLMHGLAGDDTYIVDNAFDAIAENNNEGLDTVQASVGYSLDPNVENLTLTGSDNINGGGNDLNNYLIGNIGENFLSGASGNDILVGGLGADSLDGGDGNDIYIFAKGDGKDTVDDYDTVAGDIDTLQLGAGIAQQNLWMSHVGNDLKINIMGSSDQITIENWYLGSNYQTDQIKTSDGRTMLNTDVEQLVQAMASFGAPSPSATSWPTIPSPTGQVLVAVSH